MVSVPPSHRTREDLREIRANPRLKPLDEAYIKQRVSVDDSGCWLWRPKGGTTAYGVLGRRIDSKYHALLAHRVSYEIFVGPIPQGREIDHLCSVPKCVNPDHLEVVTRVINVRRSSRWVTGETA